MEIDGKRHNMLAGIGCSKCIPYVSCCQRWRKGRISIIAVDGEQFQCEGTGTVRLRPARGGVPVEAEVIVASVKPLGFNFVLGMDGITALGGVTVDAQRHVRFGSENPVACAAVNAGLRIDERNFAASYNPDTRSWTAVWKWSGGTEPGALRNTAEEYLPAEGARASYEEELQTWIRNGWLVPSDEKKFGAARGLIPLTAAVQRNKNKARPVMDFRELNGYIDMFTAESDVCAQKLREWRRQGVNVSIIDLKNAYLQTRIDESLWPYQTVVFRRRRYCLTRLGFGLNVAPLVMRAVLKRVLSLDPEVEKGTSAYIDDILVNEDIIDASRSSYSLTCKPHERVANGARVLGLRVCGERGQLEWKRDNQVANVPERLTRRSVFSCCGKLVSHFPVCGWLRVAAAFVKRKVNDASESWDEVVDDKELRALLVEIAAAMKTPDPAEARWDVPGDAAKVWVDASALATGVAVEVNGSIVEDAAWLRPDDAYHINMAELDAVIKGLNLALSWQMKKIELMTDSVTVHRWISDGLSGRTRLRTKAASEMLIRRRVGIVLSLVKECDLDLSITLVRSAFNKADALTRVPRRWCKFDRTPTAACAATANTDLEQLAARIHHDAGHPGIRRTLYFVRRACPTASKRLIREVIANCQPCQSIDPAPEKWRRGKLGVERVWQRLAMDVTHCRGRPYLTLIDCGPSRFAVWRPLRLHSSGEVVEQLESVSTSAELQRNCLQTTTRPSGASRLPQLAARWGV
ncbi:LOW QUALITY PROTEIN: hypothetical protein M513_02343 [Trichuris suis]|uniref:RNA-directed DNA polymerase n=1 Tax=Trichuris suis TaxID=68888 RepID=A0A085MHH1_9BILA|nr:LOW QUALITY PROTEIN: hypothetical protein M513_02343 [Trichuris suis]